MHVEVVYGHFNDVLQVIDGLNELMRDRGWKEFTAWTTTVGKGNELILEAEYPDLATFERETQAFSSDAEAMPCGASHASTSSRVPSTASSSSLLRISPRTQLRVTDDRRDSPFPRGSVWRETARDAERRRGGLLRQKPTQAGGSGSPCAPPAVDASTRSRCSTSPRRTSPRPPPPDSWRLRRPGHPAPDQEAPAPGVRSCCPRPA